MLPQYPLNLITIQADALYRYDDAGRIRCVNEPHEPRAERFFMGRTTAGNVWRFRYDLPDAVVNQLDALCAAEPPRADLPTLPVNYGAIRAVLEAHAPIRGEWRGPAYFFPEAPQPVAEAILVNAGNHALLEPHFPDERYPPEAGPAAIVIADGVAVARCFCSRLTGRVAEAGLDTTAAYRGRGFAVAAVRTWAAAVLASGRLPLYSTSWQNYASQGVARRLGLTLYGEDWSIS